MVIAERIGEIDIENLNSAISDLGRITDRELKPSNVVYGLYARSERPYRHAKIRRYAQSFLYNAGTNILPHIRYILDDPERRFPDRPYSDREDAKVRLINIHSYLEEEAVSTKLQEISELLGSSYKASMVGYGSNHYYSILKKRSILGIQIPKFFEKKILTVKKIKDPKIQDEFSVTTDLPEFEKIAEELSTYIRHPYEIEASGKD